MVAVNELAKYLTVEEAAKVLDVPESRFRASWRQSGIVKPALSKGLTQFARSCIVRAAVLVCLQRVFGEQSTLAVELAKSPDPTQLDAILASELPTLDARLAGRQYVIDLDPDYFTRVREGISKVCV